MAPKTGRKIQTGGAWKSLQIDSKLRDQGLLGIEELSSYSLVKVKKKTSTTVPEKPLKVCEDAKTGTDESKTKKKKRRRNKKRKKEQTEKIAEIEDHEVINELRENDENVEKRIKRRHEACTATSNGSGKRAKLPGMVAESVEKDTKCESETEELETLPCQAIDVDMSAWRDLFVPDPVLAALRDLGFTEPTPIQRQTLPAAIKGRRDIVGAAETGSGKTLAFAIPMIHGILLDREKVVEAEEAESNSESEEAESNSDGPDDEAIEDNDEGPGCVKVIDNVEFDFEIGDNLPYPEVHLDGKSSRKLLGLVLTPTRELAIQVKNHIIAAAKYTDIKVAVVVGGMASQKQERILKQCPEIVVATPGRLWDLIQDGNPHLSTVTDIKFLAIDETDRMIEKGHFEELQLLLPMINSDESKRSLRQTFVFSATLSLIHDLPKHLRDKKRSKNMTPEEKLEQVASMIGLKPKPKVVDITRNVGTAETLTESCIHCSFDEKDIYLFYFRQMHPGRTLVFCNSIDCVRRLVNLFNILKSSPLGLHAQMHQKQRLKNLERFTEDPNGFLIATDVAARGLDINGIEHVVHYQVPRTSESYVHRSGRTARASKEGLSVMLIDPSETHLYRRMCKTLNRAEDLPMFPVDSNLLPAVKERMRLARDLDKLLLHAKKEELQKSWWKKAAEEAELIVSDEDTDEEEDSSQRKSNQKSSVQSKKAELDALLSKPLYSLGFSGKYLTMTGKLHLPSDFDKVKQTQSALTKLKTESSDRKQLLRKSKVAGSKVFLKKNLKKKKKKQKP